MPTNVTWKNMRLPQTRLTRKTDPIKQKIVRRDNNNNNPSAHMWYFLNQVYITWLDLSRRRQVAQPSYVFPRNRTARALLPQFMGSTMCEQLWHLLWYHIFLTKFNINSLSLRVCAIKKTFLECLIWYANGWYGPIIYGYLYDLFTGCLHGKN